MTIALIGEAWGRMEEVEGRPFVGRSGQALWDMLKQLGRSREDFFVSNIINRRPKDNEFSNFSAEEVEEGVQRLKGELMGRGTSVVVLLGANALKAFTTLPSIEKWRGSIIEAHGFKCIATYHPSLLIRGGKTRDGVPVRPIMMIDMKRALAQEGRFVVKYRERSKIIGASYDVVHDFLRHILEEKKRIVVDIETERGQISCIGFATSPTLSMCVPFFDEEGRYFDKNNSNAIGYLIHQILKSDKIEKIGQNFSYDMAWLEDKWGEEINGYNFDTMVAMNVCFPEFPQSLAFMTSIFTDIPYYKDNRKSEDYDVKWDYNCVDVLATYECYEKLSDEIKYMDRQRLFDFEMDVTRTMHRVARRGITFDTVGRGKLRRQARKQIKELEEAINSEVGREINPNSSKQMQDYVYGELGVKAILKRGTGQRTLDESALRVLAGKNPEISIFPLLTTQRLLKKFDSTYLGVKPDSDKKIRCSYGWTETGRLTSSSSPLQTGCNLQNIPAKGEQGKAFRKLLQASNDYQLVEVDLSQAETRVVAYESGDEQYISLFENGGDIHKQNASNIFNIPVERVSDKERQLGKKVAHATNYGMGPRTMCAGIIKELGVDYAITERDAKKFQSSYFAAYPEVKRWQERIREQLKENRTLVNALGRERYFMAPWGEGLFKEAYAFGPQSTVADLLNMCIVEWKQEEMPIVLQVHDSVLMEVPEVMLWDESKETTFSIIKKGFERLIKVGKYEIKIPVGIKVGNNWGEMDGT